MPYGTPAEKQCAGIFEDKEDADYYQQKSPEYFTVAHSIRFYGFEIFTELQVANLIILFYHLYARQSW
jgi:hypothetical protein